MTDRQNIIRLAEFVGWKLIENNGFWRWCDPDGHMRFAISNRPDHQPAPIDPYTNANDTEAVIRKLKETHIYVCVFHGEVDSIKLYGNKEWAQSLRPEWSGDDWKHGVCELALKVMNYD